MTATPIAKRLPSLCGAALDFVNSVACGLSTPSVPPDQTKATRFAASSGESFSRLAIARVNDSVAKPRVKSLAPPLPSVLPIKATISVGSTTPASISRSSAETSLGLFIASLWTPTRMKNLQPMSEL